MKFRFPFRFGRNGIRSEGLPGQRGHGKPAFTVLELLASMAVLMVVAVLSYSILNSTMAAWKAHKARLNPFEGARTAFEILTNRLGQATLNTYWDYNDPANPTRYLRQSELHFIAGKASELIPDVPNTGMDAVFFVAPLGFSDTPALDPLVKMLTACGFYVRFSDDPSRPDFLDGRVENRFRFRLYQFLQPAEQLSVYNGNAGLSRQWFRAGVEEWSFPMVDNVIGLIIRVKYPTPSGDEVAYAYDTRDGSPANPKPNFHQLPPVVAVTMVAIDEDSARRLAEKFGSAMPPILPAAGAFADPAEYEGDLRDWEQLLRGQGAPGLPKITFRFLNAEIPIRGARWSSDI